MSGRGFRQVSSQLFLLGGFMGSLFSHHSFRVIAGRWFKSMMSVGLDRCASGSSQDV